MNYPYIPEDPVVKIESIQIIRRNGKRYKQVSYWHGKTRCSTLVDPDVFLPEPGGLLPLNKLKFTWTAID